MLPNWLYGKSKSKLASILGGGGTPEDYDQVKAQVTQNTKDTTALFDNTEVNGAVNMLDSAIATQVKNDVTVTNNGDGSYTVNCSSTEHSSGSFISTKKVTLPKGTYKWTASADGKSPIGSNDCYAFIRGINGTSDWYRSYETSNGKGYGIITLTQDSEIEFGLTVAVNAIVSNLTFKPMITVASYNGDYVPYAKSNAELTSNVNDIYSNLLKTSLCESAAISVSANTDYAGTITPTTIAGYKPIGVIGFRLYGSGYTQIYASEMRLDSSDNLVHYSIRSDVLSGAVSIAVHAIVLYIKD